MPKRLLATTIILSTIFAVSMLIGIRAVEVAEANPFMSYKNIEPIPCTIPPTITIISPLNNTAYSPESVIIKFNVNKPQLARSTSYITEVYYSLDNSEDVKVYSQYVNGTGTKGVPEYSNTFTLPSLSMGNHFLTVKAWGAVIFGGGIFFMESNATTPFTVSNQQILQPTPTQNANATGSDYLLNQTNLILIAIVIAIVLVASISLVYFRRRGKS